MNEQDINEALARVRAVADMKEKRDLFNAEMDRLGINDLALKREFWLIAREPLRILYA